MSPLGERGQLHHLPCRILLHAQHECHRPPTVGSRQDLHPLLDLLGSEPRIVARVLWPDEPVRPRVLEPFRNLGGPGV